MLGFLLTLLSPLPVLAETTYSSDAAAVAEALVSIAAVAGSSVAVLGPTDPADPAQPFVHAVREELRKRGVIIVLPESAPEYNMDGMLLPRGNSWLYLGSLWRCADGALAATVERELLASATGQPPDPTLAPSRVPAKDGLRWRLLSGFHGRERAVGWLAGLSAEDGDGRWEAGFELGRFGQGRTEQGLVWSEHNLSVWHFRLRGAALLQAGDAAALRHWFPARTTLRAGGGVALVRVADREQVSGSGIPPYDKPISATAYIRPLLEAGFRYPLSERLAIDVGGEWMPDIIAPASMNVGGVSATARLLFHVWGARP